MVSAWPEPPSAMSADRSVGVGDGTEAFAFGGTDLATDLADLRHSAVPGLLLYCFGIVSTSLKRIASIPGETAVPGVNPPAIFQVSPVQLPHSSGGKWDEEGDEIY